MIFFLPLEAPNFETRISESTGTDEHGSNDLSARGHRAAARAGRPDRDPRSVARAGGDGVPSWLSSLTAVALLGSAAHCWWWPAVYLRQLNGALDPGR